MKRLLILAAVALVVQAGSASAQFVKISGAPGSGKGSGNQPPPLGPWYNYWPLEAHFQVPAMPEYPYFSAPQTLPIGREGAYGGGGGHAPHGAGGPAMARGGYPSMAPNAANNAYAGVNPYAGMNPYAVANPYAAANPYAGFNPYAARQQTPGQPGYPVNNAPQPQQQQVRPAPAQQQGAMYYPNNGYYPGAVRP